MAEQANSKENSFCVVFANLQGKSILCYFASAYLASETRLQKTDSSELASLVELVYVLCTKSRSVLCIPMGIHRNEIRS